MLYLALDQKCITEEQFKEAYNLCVSISTLLGIDQTFAKNQRMEDRHPDYSDDAHSCTFPHLTILTSGNTRDLTRPSGRFNKLVAIL